jgi:hypothetical protein
MEQRKRGRTNAAKRQMPKATAQPETVSRNFKRKRGKPNLAFIPFQVPLVKQFRRDCLKGSSPTLHPDSYDAYEVDSTWIAALGSTLCHLYGRARGVPVA